MCWRGLTKGSFSTGDFLEDIPQPVKLVSDLRDQITETNGNKLTDTIYPPNSKAFDIKRAHLINVV